MNLSKTIIEKKKQLLPYNLEFLQNWFAEIITTPLIAKDAIQPCRPNGLFIEEEAARYIIPSSTLAPHQRIQIYNQQYWWRLLNTLHANFPLLTRLFGYEAFNEVIGVPYLVKYPPNHWSITLIGQYLPQWIKECYHEPDQSLIHHAATLDLAFINSFTAAIYPPLTIQLLTQNQAEGLLKRTFYLQPHIHLFTWEYDLLTFRKSFLLQDVNYWVENAFPELPKEKVYHFIAYRNANNHIAWREVNLGELILLEYFKNGSSIENACEYIEQQDANIYEDVSKNLQKWLQTWIVAGWLTLENPLGH
jgi:hypothetical protein